MKRAFAVGQEQRCNVLDSAVSGVFRFNKKGPRPPGIDGIAWASCIQNVPSQIDQTIVSGREANDITKEDAR